MKTIEVAFLGPFAVDFVRDKACVQWSKDLTQFLSQATGEELKVRMRMCDPPFDVPESVDGKGFCEVTHVDTQVALSSTDLYVGAFKLAPFLNRD